MRASYRAAASITVAGLLLAWWLTAPQPLSSEDLPAYTPDATAGERIFWAGGCASCHAGLIDGRRARGEAKLRLGGGLALQTPYGTFRVPNISPHEDGIGNWSMRDFASAMLRGVSPDGRHYYPSFPYASYARMTVTDVMDLKAYIDTLPAVPGIIEAHDLGLPWSWRRGLGAWKRLYLSSRPVIALEDPDRLVERGRYLVEAAGHCGECHTPRNRLGGVLAERWLAGAPEPEGRGRVPNITPAGRDIAAWSAADIAYYLETGFTPDFDTVGGSMVAVQENMARLPAEDRAAIAAYLKAIPGRE